LRINAPYTTAYTSRARVYTAVYTAVYMAVYTGRVHMCTVRVHNRVHGLYTAVYTDCTRPCTWSCTRPWTRSIRAHSRSWPVCVHGRVHGLVRIRPVYKARTRAVSSPLNRCHRPPPPVDEAASRSQVDQPSTGRRLCCVQPQPLRPLIRRLNAFFSIASACFFAQQVAVRGHDDCNYTLKF